MKLMSKYNISSLQIVILFLLFLGSMNVGNLYYYFIFLAFFISLVFNFHHMRFDYMSAVLMLFSLCYVVFYPKFRTSASVILKQFIFPMCYLIGHNFIRRDKNNYIDPQCEEDQVSIAIIAPAMGALGHYLLNMLINFDSLNRNNVDIWTGEIVVATGQASLAIMSVGVFCALIFSKRSQKLKFISVIGLLLIFLYNLVLAGRTLLFLMIAILVVAFIYSITTSHVKRKGKILFVLIFVSLFVSLIYMQNVFGIRDLILGSNLTTRFDKIDMIEDNRISNKLVYFVNMVKYPFGGGKLRSAVGGFAHELYLDVYSDIGFIGYILVIIFVLSTVSKALKIIKGNRASNNFKLLLICVFIAVLIEFWLEPIMIGVPWMFCAFCFYSGVLKKLETTTVDSLNNV